MKKNYTTAEATLFIYAAQDIITTSPAEIKLADAFVEGEEDSKSFSQLFG